MKNELNKRIDVAFSAAKAAGKILIDYLKRPLKISYKGEIDLVTDADKAAEERIISIIHEFFPADALLAEESDAKLGDSNWRWIIDPLDGTTNFAHAFPIFCTSIAVEYNKETLAGVVFDPTRNELFHAVKTQGAYLNNSPIKVSDTSSLSTSLLATGFPYDRRNTPDYYLEFFKNFMLNSQAVRRCGAAALDLCYLACGRIDGFWELKLHPWDTAAGTLILNEAGGIATDFSGGEFNIFMKEIAGSNSKIHQELLQVIQKTYKK